MFGGRCTVTCQLSRSGNPTDSAAAAAAVFILQLDLLFTHRQKRFFLSARSFVTGDKNCNGGHESESEKHR